jgi:hypothetical protein
MTMAKCDKAKGEVERTARTETTEDQEYCLEFGDAVKGSGKLNL